MKYLKRLPIIFLIVCSMFCQEIKSTVPVGASIKLNVENKLFFVGENIFIEYCVLNNSNEDFWIETKGDYRGSPRHARFIVRAFNELGQAVEDPTPDQFSMGGFLSTTNIDPGQKYCEIVPVHRYCIFDKPGVYNISIKHDLGWKETKDQKIPHGSITVKFVMPTEKQARKFVEDIYKDPDFEHKDSLESIRWNVYLPVLEELAWKKNLRALQAISQIKTEQSTAALLDLMEHPDEKISQEAVEIIGERLPGQFLYQFEEKAWNKRFIKDIDRFARENIFSTNKDLRDKCISFFELIGNKKALPLLMKILNGAYPYDNENKEYLFNDLCRAISRILKREGGVEFPVERKTVGENILYFLNLNEKFPYPEGWSKCCLKLLQHKNKSVRKLALETVPLESKEIIAYFLKFILDEDIDFQIIACARIASSEKTKFKPLLLQMLQTTNSVELFRDIYQCLWILEAKSEALNVVVSRLHEENIPCFEILQRIFVISMKFIPEKISAEEINILKTTWRNFLKSHHEDINNERIFWFGDKGVSRNLFPKKAKFDISWPTRTLKEIIEGKTHLNSRDEQGYTPLMRFVSSNNKQAVKQLLVAKADVNIKAQDPTSIEKLSALSIAAKIDIEMVKILITAGANVDVESLIEAIYSRNYEIVKLLITEGVDVNYQYEYNSNALHLAVDIGSLQIAKAVFLAGTDINSQDENGDTPLLFAIDSNENEIAKFLINSRANIHIKNKNGYDALYLAKRMNNKEIIALLKKDK
ncbi:ankyrin repeat domain-containing protein [Candidatus Uabimicrobium sp. HlEnr_7]|uniref:ankyrin repeat domain-containing protein n=1 Tax=Candidatus Uabimicrobium helgolandensis TaxID=3095367 RepID=UPI003559314D